MMVEKEDLCLSLNLNFPAPVERNQFCNSSSPQLNLPTSLASSSPRFNWKDSFPSTSATYRSSYCPFDLDDVSPVRVETKSIVKGIDVNLMPGMAVEVEEEAGVSSPNSSVSSISGKRSDGGKISPRGTSDEEDGDNSRKKLRLSEDQSVVLEESFKEHHTPNLKQKHVLAVRLGLRPRQVEVWFQNRRARTKMKQTELECELMKRCCENLTEENMRLQKELQELRALKLSPQFYTHRTPPTTLTICPSCENVAVPPPPPSMMTAALKPHSGLALNPWAGHRQ